MSLSRLNSARERKETEDNDFTCCLRPDSKSGDEEMRDVLRLLQCLRFLFYFFIIPSFTGVLHSLFLGGLRHSGLYFKCLLALYLYIYHSLLYV